MKEYNPSEIDYLISCPKLITEGPKNSLKINASRKENSFKLSNEDETIFFEVIMRQSIIFPTRFSLGLKHLQSAEDSRTFLILRYNGAHGEPHNFKEESQPHYGFHSHKISSQDLNKNITEPQIVKIEEYTYFEEATLSFLKKINVLNWTMHPYFNILNANSLKDKLFD
jgi:hypothetical protein